MSSPYHQALGGGCAFKGFYFASVFLPYWRYTQHTQYERFTGKLLLQRFTPPGYSSVSSRLGVCNRPGKQQLRQPTQWTFIEHRKLSAIEPLEVNVFSQDAKKTGDAHGSDVFIVAALCAISRSSSRRRYSQNSINTIHLYRRPFLSIASKHANQLNCRLLYTRSREPVMNQDAKPVRLVYPQEFRGPKRASSFVLRTSNSSILNLFCLEQH